MEFINLLHGLTHQVNNSPQQTVHTKVKELDTFDRVDPWTLKVFILSLHLNFNNRPNAFLTDATKVNYAISFPSGVTLNWFKLDILHPNLLPKHIPMPLSFQNSIPILTKTIKEQGALVILTAHKDDLCPIQALQNHLQVNADVPADAPLFAYSSPSGWQHLYKPSFFKDCAIVWTTANLTHIHGHSFRIRGAVELLLAGVPPEVVAAAGGWTSLAFLIYWCHMEEIIPMSTSKAYKKAHIDELAKNFKTFCITHRFPKALPTEVNIFDNLELL
ncbi:hypothetical protein IW261DRAFT_1569525 [Armillaria novae-zelandiae]|uniref:Uncharacterized protein n=1 Tax=Armillaria novae-zelandiae TaxID=153914 RepID=A0AA39NXR0_9AGAR|nr:hypothetical protein IW261DRAFT_1569525 [Armillaria novae-zelandiae]